MNSVETAATAAAFFVRYRARTGLGAPEDVRTGRGTSRVVGAGGVKRKGGASVFFSGRLLS